MEVLLKMLTRTHSDQCVGICSKSCRGQRREGDSMVKETHAPRSSFRGPAEAVQWSEDERKSVLILPLPLPWLLSTPQCWAPGGHTCWDVILSRTVGLFAAASAHFGFFSLCDAELDV